MLWKIVNNIHFMGLDTKIDLFRALCVRSERKVEKVLMM